VVVEAWEFTAEEKNMISVCMECVGAIAMKMIEWINEAGDEALGILHKLAYPECKIPIEHCHKEKEND